MDAYYIVDDLILDINPLCRRCDILRIALSAFSLNTDTAEKYDALCHPNFPGAYEAMLDFARQVKAYVPTVMMTVVDTIPPEEIEHCRRICEEDVGATYRVRAYIKE